MPFIERKEEKKKKERINKGDIVKVQITKSLSTKPRSAGFFFLCASFDMPFPILVHPCGSTTWTWFFVNIVKLTANSCAAFELGINYWTFKNKLKAIRGAGGN